MGDANLSRTTHSGIHNCKLDFEQSTLRLGFFCEMARTNSLVFSLLFFTSTEAGKQPLLSSWAFQETQSVPLFHLILLCVGTPGGFEPPPPTSTLFRSPPFV